MALNILRWLLALLSIPIVIWILYICIAYPFEWLLNFSVTWGIVPHILFWLLIGTALVKICIFLGAALASLAARIVQEVPIYAGILSIALLVLAVFCIYGAWSSTVEFSWERLKHATLNKVIFTGLILNYFWIPVRLFENAVDG